MDGDDTTNPPKNYTKREKKNLQLGNHAVALVQDLSSIVDQLVNNGLGRLLVVDHSSGLTHQVRTSVVNVVVVNVVGHVLEVVLNGDNTLGSELLNLLCAVLLPVLDIFVLADTKGTTLGFLSVTNSLTFRIF